MRRLSDVVEALDRAAQWSNTMNPRTRSCDGATDDRVRSRRVRRDNWCGRCRRTQTARRDDAELVSLWIGHHEKTTTLVPVNAATSQLLNPSLRADEITRGDVKVQAILLHLRLRHFLKADTDRAGRPSQPQ